MISNVTEANEKMQKESLDKACERNENMHEKGTQTEMKIKESDRMDQVLRRMRDEYDSHEMSKEQVRELKKKMKEAIMDNQKKKVGQWCIRVAASVAGIFGVIIILSNSSASIAHAMGQVPVLGKIVDVVTFRNYEYESERNNATVEVPEIVVDDIVDLSEKEDEQVQDNLLQTTEEINAEIQQITDKIIADFEANLMYEEGYQDVLVESEVLTQTEDYFTLKLLCYQGAGSGYQWNYYYTIDLSTGERMQLKDLFVEGADYITPISENIKQQMQEQMDADDMVYYWLNDEIEEWNFKSITEETAFYINETGNVVICFNEGDVAPMYMGCVEFEIPGELLAEIRK
ncbi:MAG: DUF3298 domain-containing protein [Lachnospiraceae bacterium]